MCFFLFLISYCSQGSVVDIFLDFCGWELLEWVQFAVCSQNAFFLVELHSEHTDHLILLCMHASVKPEVFKICSIPFLGGFRCLHQIPSSICSPSLLGPLRHAVRMFWIRTQSLNFSSVFLLVCGIQCGNKSLNFRIRWCSSGISCDIWHPQDLCQVTSPLCVSVLSTA